MFTLRFEGNQFFFNNVEMVRYVGTHRESGPAHDQEIVCVGSSINNERLVSVCKAGRLHI